MYQRGESAEVAIEPVSIRLQRIGAILAFGVFLAALIAPRAFESLL